MLVWNSVGIGRELAEFAPTNGDQTDELGPYMCMCLPSGSISNRREDNLPT